MNFNQIYSILHLILELNLWEDTHLITLLLVRRHVHLRALVCTCVHLRALFT